MSEHINLNEGRRLFGLNPQGYEDTRPDYPVWIFDHLRDRGALVDGTPTLEIGAGTGKATRRLLEYGANPLTIVEPDARFAALLGKAVRYGSGYQSNSEIWDLIQCALKTCSAVRKRAFAYSFLICR